MRFELPLFKVFTRPIIPIHNSWVDAFPIIIIFLLFGTAIFFAVFIKNKTTPRRILQTLGLVIFIILIHRCLCIIRGWVFGITEIGRDDLRAFENLCMFIPIFGFSIVFGRIFCGWICPLGFLQEITGSISSKKGKRNHCSLILFLLLLSISTVYFYFFRPSTDFFTENIAAVWSVILLVILIYLWFRPGFPTEKIKYYSLAGWILLGIVGVFLTNPWCVLYGNELDYSAIIALFIVLSVATVHSQPWCRYLCPVGGLLALLSKFRIIKLKVYSERINTDCTLICPTGALSKKKIKNKECILCGRCMERCGVKIEPIRRFSQ